MNELKVDVNKENVSNENITWGRGGVTEKKKLILKFVAKENVLKAKKKCGRLN